MKIALTLLLTLFFVFVNAQNPIITTTQSSIPLIEVLDLLEDQNTKISYSNEEVKGIVLNLNTTALTIENLEALLPTQTFLEIKEITPNSYIIVRSQNSILICGKVIDRITQRPLKGVNVSVNNNTGTFTDSSGNFEITISFKDKVSLQYPGYKTKQISLKDFHKTTCATINFSELREELNEVIIEEYLTTGIEKNFDGSIDFSPSTLRILPGLTEPDVFESAQLLPGISSPGESASRLNIRGGSSDQNLILWDGIPMYHTGHFFDQISAFNPYITENIKIYKGGTSVKYGGRLSGVIDIQSDSKIPTKIHGGGGFNLTSADLFLRIPVSKKIGVFLASRRSIQDIYKSVTFENIENKVLENSQTDGSDTFLYIGEEPSMTQNNSFFYDINGKIVWQPTTTDQIRLSTIFIKNSTHNFVENTKNFTSTNLAFTNNGASLVWDKALEKYKHSILFNASQYRNSTDDISFVNSNSDLSPDNSSSTSSSNNENIVSEIGTTFNTEIALKKNQFWLNGYQFSYTELPKSFLSETVTMPFDPDSDLKNEINLFEKIINHSIFSEYKLQNNVINLNAGIRLSILNQKILWEPRFFSSFKITPEIFASSSFEVKNQYMNILVNQNISPSLNIDNLIYEWVLSLGTTIHSINESLESIEENLTIPVINNTQWTAGLNYNNHGWNIDVEGYYKLIKNITTANQTTINPSVPSLFSIGNEKRIGMDILVKKRLNNFRMWIGYSLSKSTLEFDEIRKDPFPGNFDRRHVLNSAATLEVKPFEFALGWSYASGKRYTDTSELLATSNGTDDDLLTLNYNSLKLPDFHRLDASILYKFNFSRQKTWKGTFGLSIRNIYNRTNILNRTFQHSRNLIFNDDRSPIQADNSSLKITPNFLFRLHF